MTLNICGPSRGEYGLPWRIDGPRGIKGWITARGDLAKPPRTLRCTYPGHFLTVRENRCNYPRGECSVQHWKLTRQEVHDAIEAFDMFSLDMPPRFLCPSCTREERNLRKGRQSE